MNEYMLGALSNYTHTFDIVASNVARIDIATSAVRGETAEIHVVLAKGLSTEKVRLGFSVTSDGRVVKRSTISRANLEWATGEVGSLGKAVIPVPRGAVVNAIVSNEGAAQHYCLLSDPSAFQNTRRAAYEAFDADLTTLKDIVAKAGEKGQEARDLEAAVAWLLWMLGFSVVQLGGTRRTQEAADLLATIPSGHIAVVECTTGLLKAENKLALLHKRTEAVRSALAASNRAQFRVMPIVVSSQPREVVKPDIEQAERLGILVYTREDLQGAFNHTLVQVDIDRFYARPKRLFAWLKRSTRRRLTFRWACRMGRDDDV